MEWTPWPTLDTIALAFAWRSANNQQNDGRGDSYRHAPCHFYRDNDATEATRD